jgi:hypothetical protein
MRLLLFAEIALLRVLGIAVLAIRYTVSERDMDGY